ncbi:hypothetical protein A2U01_0069267, partial [Trifolium medium]|nr:hypothetical protein [Trifolium medium]
STAAFNSPSSSVNFSFKAFTLASKSSFPTVGVTDLTSITVDLCLMVLLFSYDEWEGDFAPAGAPIIKLVRGEAKVLRMRSNVPDSPE